MVLLQRYRWMVLLGWMGGWLGGGPSPAGPAEEDRIVLTADGWARINPAEEKVTARDNVVVQYRDMVLRGDRLQADFRSQEVEMEGNVTITTQGQTIACDGARFNLKTQDYAVRNARLTLTPDFIGGGVVEPLFVAGGEATAKGKEEVRIQHPALTSCDREHPHYLLSAKRVVIYPERKMILWKAGLSALGQRLISLPKFEVPLRNLRRGWPLVPDVGRNDVEGYYLKTFYQMPTSSLDHSTGVQFDLTEKQGIRLGAEHRYRTQRQRRGWIDLDYALKGGSLSARFDHQEQFSREFSANLRMDYNERNAFAFAARQLNANLQLRHSNRQGSSSTLSLRRQSSDGRDSLSANLTHRSQWGSSRQRRRGVQVNLNADFYRRPTSQEKVHDEELNTRLNVSGQGARFRWTLRDERRFDLDGDAYTQDTFFAHTDAVPHLTLMSDSRQLKLGLPRNVSSNLEFSLGQFRETIRSEGQPLDVDVFRTHFEVGLRASRVPLSGSLFLNSNLGYEQSFFSDGTAKYNLRASNSFAAELGSGWDLRLAHFYQRPFGFSPLSRFDFTGRSDRLTTSLNFSEGRRTGTGGGVEGYGGYGGWEDYEGAYGGGGYYRSRRREGSRQAPGYGRYDPYGGYRRSSRGRQPWRASFNTGFDLLRSRWNSLGINAGGSLSGSSRMNLNTRYDFDGRGFGDVNLQVQYTHPHLALDTSLQYSPRQDTKLNAVRSFISWRASRKVRLETLLEYRGRDRKLAYNDVLLTYDLHCWEAVLVYNKQRGDFRLDLNLKAYPRSDFGFGVGSLGQGFDTSLGGYY